MDAITSVLHQTGVTFEILVVDDCPESSARGVVLGLQDARVTYLGSPIPTGGFPSLVRNMAWPIAEGRFVHFLDDDDIVPSGHYAKVKATFESRPEIGLVFGMIEPFGVCPEEQLQHERRYFIDAARSASRCSRFGTRFGFTGRMLFGVPILVCSAGVVRRECVAAIGGFDPQIRLMEDADFYARIMRKFGAYFLDEVAVRYCIGSPSLMHSPLPSQSQLLDQRKGRRRMQSKYRNEHGVLEFFALALFARTVLKVVCRRRSSNYDQRVDHGSFSVASWPSSGTRS
jgi:glycosyltransferase involved in cell wall biosynthesis